jgi:hypothetical protein
VSGPQHVLLVESTGGEWIAFGPFVTRDECRAWRDAHLHLRAIGLLELYPAAGTSAMDETRPFPPIGQTIRRRPPVPGIRELRGSELLRVLADELDRDGLGGEDL